MLSTQANLNLVLSGDVQGRVTLYLKDVDIQDAFDIILLSNNLAYDKRGDIIYVMPQKDYEDIYGERFGDKKATRIIRLKYSKAEEAAKTLGQAKTKVGRVIVDVLSNSVVLIDNLPALDQMAAIAEKIDVPTVTRIFELRYASAKDLKEKVLELITKDLGSVQMDERSNHLVVTDAESRMPQIEKVIEYFDAKPRQVLIDAKIVQVTLSDQYKLGVDWQALFRTLNRNVELSSTFRLKAAGTLDPGIEASIGTFDSDNYSMLIQALKSIGDTNTLSNPQITAINGEEAKILVGESRPYAINTVVQGNGTVTTASTLSFIEIGVKLYVTPSINQDGFVTMKIRPEVSSTTDNYTYGNPATTVPIVTTTQAETSISVKDGRTIIIAGLIKDSRTGNVDKIPILGDLPILGNLFRKIDNGIDKQELVIFLTPHIISGGDDYLKVPLTKADELKKFTMPERDTFERRDPTPVDPSHFKKGRIAGAQKAAPVTSFAVSSTGLSAEEYYYQVKNEILNHLSFRKTKKGSVEGSLKIAFTLASDGRLLAGPQVLASTNENLNATVIQAVQNAAPFTPFPEGMRQTEKRLTVDFVFE